MSDYDPLETQAVEQARDEDSARSKRQQQIEADDLKWLMSDKRGRRIVWRLLADAGVYRSSFATNALTMAFSEGQRDLGLRWLGKVVEQSPAQYAQMVAEHNK